MGRIKITFVVKLLGPNIEHQRMVRTLKAYKFCAVWKGTAFVTEAFTSRIKYRVETKGNIYFWHDT